MSSPELTKASYSFVSSGYFKIKACARMADAGASFFSRLHHQTTILHTAAGRLQPLELASSLTPVVGPCLETALCLGATERGACRLVASRVPEPMVHARRRHAHKKAKKQGSTPSKAHLTLLAWNLFLTKVPPTIWKMEALFTAYPLRWHSALLESHPSKPLPWCSTRRCANCNGRERRRLAPELEHAPSAIMGGRRDTMKHLTMRYHYTVTDPVQDER